MCTPVYLLNHPVCVCNLQNLRITSKSDAGPCRRLFLEVSERKTPAGSSHPSCCGKYLRKALFDVRWQSEKEAAAQAIHDTRNGVDIAVTEKQRRRVKKDIVITESSS
jgi:hypothetical protein